MGSQRVPRRVNVSRQVARSFRAVGTGSDQAMASMSSRPHSTACPAACVVGEEQQLPVTATVTTDDLVVRALCSCTASSSPSNRLGTTRRGCARRRSLGCSGLTSGAGMPRWPASSITPQPLPTAASWPEPPWRASTLNVHVGAYAPNRSLHDPAAWRMTRHLPAAAMPRARSAWRPQLNVECYA